MHFAYQRDGLGPSSDQGLRVSVFHPGSDLTDGKCDFIPFVGSRPSSCQQLNNFLENVCQP